MDGYIHDGIESRGKSEDDTFKDNAVQNLKSTGTSTGATFYNSAKQVISDFATSTGSVFNDQSSLQMTGGKSDAAIFKNQSSFIVSGGEIKNATMNNASTGLLDGSGKATGITTVNNNASLNIVAKPAFDPVRGSQAENVILNKGGGRSLL